MRVRLRRVIAIALIGAAGACFSPQPPEGVPCSPEGHCPDDQRCVEGICRGPDVGQPDAVVHGDAMGVPDGVAMVDTDADGIIDSADNCPTVPNVDQYDDDLDGEGDTCDVCPPIADPAQADTDADGVGDACDPNPDSPTEAWVLFESFHAPLGLSWALPAGWQVSGDALHSPSDVTTQANAVYQAPMPSVYVITRLHLTALDPDAGPIYRSAGAITASDGITEYRCVIRDAIGQGASGGIARGGTVLASDPMSGSGLGAKATITFLDAGNSLRCDGATDDGRSWSTTATDNNLGTGKVGLRVQNSVASFDYIAVISVAP